MRFTIPGPPVPKGRPRVVRRNAFTPARTRRFEQLVKMCALTAGLRPLDGDVHLTCAFYLPDKRHRDCDNLQKAIQDALNGVAYRDDSQVKSWQGLILVDRVTPRTVVTVEAML